MKNKTILFLLAAAFLGSRLAFAEQQIPAQPSPPSALKVSNDKISLDIKGMDIVDTLKMLAARTGMNIAIGKNVTGKVTLYLKDVNAQDAFDIILLSNDLAFDKKGEITNIMTQRDYELIYGERFQDKKQAKTVMLKFAKAVDLSRALNQIKSNLGRIVVDEGSNSLVIIDTPQMVKQMESFIKSADMPTETRIFTLNYAPVEKIQPKIQEALTKGIGSIKFDERTNKIAVTDYPGKLDEISKVLSAFDEKTPQVLIDAQIIEIKPSDKFEMGVDWNFFLEKNFQLKAALPAAAGLDRLFLGTPNNTPTKKGDFKAIIDILRTIGDTKILSSPRIMALNNEEAKILVGTKEAFITSTTTVTQNQPVVSQTVNFVDVGIKLYVTPTINKDGFITMRIRPEISSAETRSIKSGDLTTDIPIVSTSEAETSIMIKDGITVIIGGLRKDDRQKTVKKIPFLGDLPLLGQLFRSTVDHLQIQELVILLTPHIVSGESPLTDFSEIKPSEGAVATMERGEILIEKVSSKRQEEFLNSFVAEKELVYYNDVTGKIFASAQKNPPKDKKGEVTLSFLLSSEGKLLEEPKVINASDPSLAPFAIQAVKSASPFPAFPKNLAKNKQRFKINLSY